jgi:uncharacterized hydrophobic protein (TIGR00271 family)
MSKNYPDFIHVILGYLNLESEVDDYEKIHETIEKDIIFRGTNLWILIFAIIVASVGLNMNSTAVIIGAMLISPLMGPINGMGYSIATYNFPLFRKSAKNFTFAVGASLVASTAYFAISPISTAHSELLARTSPTIYDVLIALFGGLAGIVAISSKQKGNVIPGVAIATALMPPLCTAGYGLATGQLNYFFGAFYLFTINTVFIAISSVVISQLLKFPIRTLVDAAQKKRVNQWISFVIVLVLFPSIYFGYNLVQKETFNENAARYINNISVVDGNYLLKHEIHPNQKNILLIYGGATFSEEQKESIRSKAADFDLNKVNIEFRQGLSLDEFAVKSSEVDNLKIEINRLNLALQEKQVQLDSLASRGTSGQRLLEEVRIMYPQIVSCSYGEALVFSETSDAPGKEDIVIFTLNGKPLVNGEREKIEAWVRARLNSENVRVYYRN